MLFIGSLLYTFIVGRALIERIRCLNSLTLLISSVFSSSILETAVFFSREGNLRWLMERSLLICSILIYFSLSFDTSLAYLSWICSFLRDPGCFLRGSNLTLSLFSRRYLFISIGSSVIFISIAHINQVGKTAPGSDDVKTPRLRPSILCSVSIRNSCLLLKTSR